MTVILNLLASLLKRKFLYYKESLTNMLKVEQDIIMTKVIVSKYGKVNRKGLPNVVEP